MTGLGEDVFTPAPDGVGDVEKMVEEAARGVCCTRPDGSDDGIWPCPLCKRMNTPPMARPCAAQARAALESLGVDLAVLADVVAERKRQDEQWGGPEHDDSHRPDDWEDFIINQIRRAEKETSDAGYRRRLVNVVALGFAALGSWDRTHARMPRDDRR
jgi:hypothetical protein